MRQRVIAHTTLRCVAVRRWVLLVRFAVLPENVGQFAGSILRRRRAGLHGVEHGTTPEILVSGIRSRSSGLLDVAQVLAGDVQVQGRRAQALVPHQPLDGRQVHAGFHQMGGKRMPQTNECRVPCWIARSFLGPVEDLLGRVHRQGTAGPAPGNSHSVGRYSRQ